MTNFIPIFPLSAVVFPGQELKLRIFEPRYKQLIRECTEQEKPFGIPAIIQNEMKEYGSLVKIKEITRVLDNGEMLIITAGIKIFRILEVIKDVPDKLYSGAIVTYSELIEDGDPALRRELISNLRKMYKLLKVEKPFQKKEDELNSYDIAHYIGLPLKNQYEMLLFPRERQRQKYLNDFLKQMIPMIFQIEEMKEKIKSNGHFKNLTASDLDL
ncbi:MAG: LON peptidase substrate-binding domain-containing protein [Chitinophagaceae bacterium]|nr:LON peptidase substrate-binding domain-containing protein [Chitinophagaceae bacterium]